MRLPCALLLQISVMFTSCGTFSSFGEEGSCIPEDGVHMKKAEIAISQASSNPKLRIAEKNKLMRYNYGTLFVSTKQIAALLPSAHLAEVCLGFSVPAHRMPVVERKKDKH